MSTRGVRRLGGLCAGVALVSLALVAAAVVTAVGDRHAVRIDVTSGGSQRLSPRTEALIDQISLLGGAEVVVVADMATIDPRARRTVRDVLDLLGHAGDVRTVEIDAGSSGGQAEFDALIARLVERDRDEIEAYGAALGRAGEAARAAAAEMTGGLSRLLGEVRAGLASPAPDIRAAAAGVEQWTTLLSLRARSLESVADGAERALAGEDGSGPLAPLPERAGEARAAMEAAIEELGGLLTDMNRVGQIGSGGEARSVRERAGEVRDALAREVDALARLGRVDAFRVAGALSSGEVALVIGPEGTGVAGIDIGALYEPTLLAAEGDRLIGDVRAHAEELIGSAFSSLLTESKPIVVLVHGEATDPLTGSAFFTGVRERLMRRGIEMVAWGAAGQPEPPDLLELDPDGVRPVVFVTLSPDSSGSARTERELPGPERAAALGRAVGLILDRGLPLLLNVNPSVLPSYGEADPVTAPLAALGVTIESGTPILAESVSSQGRRVFTDMRVLPARGEHPLERATANLPLLLPWPIAVRVGETPEGVEATVIAELEDDGRIWRESQWLGYWQVPRAQRAVLPEQPAYDEGADGRDGPWPVVVAIDRVGSGRVVVVGSNGWYANPAAFEYRTTDGRVSLVSPGNGELFEAAVLYLAGMEGLIAQSATARATPLVGPMDPGRLSMLRWLLVAGLPLGTLAVGVAWRVIRG